MRLLCFFALLLPLPLPGQAVNASRLPEGPGRATTARLCGGCHGFGNFMRRRETRDGWNAVIEDMIARGAKGEEEEWAEVSDYLVAQFSPVRVKVNQAAAPAIAEALGIRLVLAEEVVKYREANGPFKDIEDFRKVPGLENADFDSRRNRLEF